MNSCCIQLLPPSCHLARCAANNILRATTRFWSCIITGNGGLHTGQVANGMVRQGRPFNARFIIRSKDNVLHMFAILFVVLLLPLQLLLLLLAQLMVHLQQPSVVPCTYSRICSTIGLHSSRSTGFST